jgi:uncharacterized membrane protein SpoIIM required for sporulation
MVGALAATVLSAVVMVFVVLQLDMWMMLGNNVPLLRLRRMKLAKLGSSDHGEDSRPMFHKVSVSSLAANRFIGSKSILVCDGALPNLGISAAMVASEDDNGQCFDEAQVSIRIEL